ncbi:MAG: PIN domain-containing protein [Candidatus Diapherotrites archaeon]
MRLYLDSNVLISYLRSEIDKAFNVRFQSSEKFFAACGLLKTELVISQLFLVEIKKKVFSEEKGIKQLFEDFGIKTTIINNVEKDKVLKIMKETEIHFADATHIANAVEYNCEYISTTVSIL